MKERVGFAYIMQLAEDFSPFPGIKGCGKLLCLLSHRLQMALQLMPFAFCIGGMRIELYER